MLVPAYEFKNFENLVEIPVRVPSAAIVPIELKISHYER
jgi:hypothetical protein